MNVIEGLCEILLRIHPCKKLNAELFSTFAVRDCIKNVAILSNIINCIDFKLISFRFIERIRARLFHYIRRVTSETKFSII